jgi:Asp-tRNA(Asn)/Glu-tRNA(Gln) amidotransferase A subunit family amidase
MKDKPYQMGAAEAVREMQSGTLSVCEYIDSCIGRIEELEFTRWRLGKSGLRPGQTARVELDQKLRRNWGSTGALFGLPVGVKDVFNTSDFPTEMGSPIWRGFRPGNDARAVSELLQHDALVMGKTVTAEFAVHHPGSTVNPTTIKGHRELHQVVRRCGGVRDGSAGARYPNGGFNYPAC